MPSEQHRADKPEPTSDKRHQNPNTPNRTRRWTRSTHQWPPAEPGALENPCHRRN